MIGHLTGILAALALKYLFLYDLCVLPRYSWIKVVDKFLGIKMYHLLEEYLSYYPAGDQIYQEFSSDCWSSLTNKVRKCISKMGRKIRSQAPQYRAFNGEGILIGSDMIEE